MIVHAPAVWLGFTALIIALLVVDLGVFGKQTRTFTFAAAASWAAFLFALAIGFAGFLWWSEGSAHALEFTAGYLVEMALSVDNLFVFLFLFRYFAVPPSAQPTVLKWGIIGAIVLRAIMIGLGAALFARFEWITWVFGGLLVITGLRMFRPDQEEGDPENNQITRIARRILPFTGKFEGNSFVARAALGAPRRYTPLLLVLIVVEWTDLVFAIDSIPAVFAVTRDPFLVYSSNIFAILGLRAMFFILSGALDKFRFLKPGVALILVLVGLKMVLEHWWEASTLLSLGTIVGILAIAIVASLLIPAAAPPAEPPAA